MGLAYVHILCGTAIWMYGARLWILEDTDTDLGVHDGAEAAREEGHPLTYTTPNDTRHRR